MMSNNKFLLRTICLLLVCLFTLSCSLFDFNNSDFNGISQEVPVFIQFDSSCEYENLVLGDVRKEIEMESFVLIGTDATKNDIISLKEENCVIRTFRPSELKNVIEDLQNDFNADRDSQFEELKMKRGLEKQDVLSKEELRELLENKHPEQTWPGGVISPYQLYVTPEADAVVDLAAQLDGIQEIYNEALSWIWVSEEYLNGVAEHWYYPEEFLTDTPNLENNPSLGDIASDCSEQANTLVSLLVADGWGTGDVRVVLGLVDFQGTTGGHAWAEVYENGQWFALEATSGAYYDENSNTLVRATHMPYRYFKYATYPVEEIWYYYNNEYFWDETTGTGNAPVSWRQDSAPAWQEELENFQGQQGQVTGKI